MRHYRKGIYLLPNLFTTAALYAGFYSILATIDMRYEVSAISIFVAMLLDGMDGRIARLTNTQSDFGMQYDSLSDMVAFGVAPSLLVYQFCLANLGNIGWLSVFFYTACVALRLARYNVQSGTDDKSFFQGLPSPVAAAVLAGLVWLCVHNQYLITGIWSFFVIVLCVILSLLMISSMRYHSLKQFDLRGKMPLLRMIFVLSVFVLIAYKPSLILFMMAFLYALHGPILTLWMVRKRRDHKHSTKEH